MRLTFCTLILWLLPVLIAGAPSDYAPILESISTRSVADGIHAMTQNDRLGGVSGRVRDWLVGPRFLGAAGEVRVEGFDLTIPDPDARATLRLHSGAVSLHPLWPNGVRTSTCNVTGSLVYAGRGGIGEFNGKTIAGSIVILEFDSGLAWLTAARLGAQAVVFLEPELANRGEAEAKWSDIPTTVPRFWAGRESRARLLAAAGKSASLDCRQDWVDARGENFMATIRGSDPSMRDEWIVVAAYADGVSIVPGLSPGADQASGAAALAAIVRHFAAQRPKRSILFLVTTAHFQAMQGMRAFVERRFQEGWAMTGGVPPQCFFTLDLSSQSSSISSVAKGWWFDYRDENHEGERGISKSIMQHVPEIAEAMRMDAERVAFDGVNNPDGRNWRNNVPGRFGVEAEILNMAGLNAITFVTNADVRDLQDTPHDTADRVHTGNLVAQARTIACLLWHAANETQDERQGTRAIPYRGGASLSRMSLMSGFGTVEGKVLRYDPQRSFLPDVPVPNALVEYAQFYRCYMGIRGIEMHRARGKNAEYSIYGVPTVTAWPSASRYPVGFLAYVLNDDGAITHATDFGIQGSGQFSSMFLMTTTYRETPIVVFPAVASDYIGLVDPQSLKAINYLMALDARNDGQPPSYSYVAPLGSFNMRSFVENSAVVFAPADRRLKVTGTAGFSGISLLLSNATLESPRGEGLGANEVLPWSFVALQSAHDLWRISEDRRQLLNRHNISNAGLDALLDHGRQDINDAATAYASKDYREGDRLSQRAWGYVLRAHPEYKATMSDIVNGLVFYLALLLPFSYFLERLLFASGKLSTQLLIGSCLFAATFFVLRLMHPAFDITGNTFMIFVAFAIGSLSLVVITFVVGKFETSLQKLQQVASGVHEERVAKISLAVTALGIGISNMRRRKARTILTCATLVLVTFIVLSFTSVVSDFRFNRMPAEGTPRYSGVLFRERELTPVESSAYESLQSIFNENVPVGRRAWFYGGAIGSLSAISVRRSDRSVSINVVLGLDVAEERITRPQEALLEGGRWFQDGERNVALVPRSLADKLGVRGPGDFVRLGGVDLQVIGVLDDSRLKSVIDLDNESIVPADFTQSRSMQDRGQGGDFAFRKYVRYDPGSVIVVPADFAIHIGADIRSLAAAFATFEAAEAALTELMPRMSLNLYAGVPGASGPVIEQFSTVASTKSRGFEYVVVPILIAAMIVLNTMIASVLERQREIGIFSAVGLSPKQIAALFFAESLVYAVIGAVLGYLLAQAVGAFVAWSGMFTGLTLNYSSLSAVYATLIVVGVVLVTTLYPAKRAREIATPSGESEWFTHSPVTDEWTIELPFTVTRGHASALALFYSEWFLGYEDYGAGEFVTENVETSAKDGTFIAQTKCWLAPFDLGVQQNTALVFEPTDMNDVYSIKLKLERLSGDPENWENLNHRFLRALRKQFLVWRTLSVSEKRPYLEMQIPVASA